MTSWFTNSHMSVSPARLRSHQEVNGVMSVRLAAPESTESRKLGGLSQLTLPFYQEEAGRLFVPDPKILCAYLAFAPFPSVMASLSR